MPIRTTGSNLEVPRKFWKRSPIAVYSAARAMPDLHEVSLSLSRKSTSKLTSIHKDQDRNVDFHRSSIPKADKVSNR